MQKYYEEVLRKRPNGDLTHQPQNAGLLMVLGQIVPTQLLRTDVDLLFSGRKLKPKG
jgi:hypothetical protein